jgi:hypothetical protein
MTVEVGTSLQLGVADLSLHVGVPVASAQQKPPMGNRYT